MEFYWLEKAFMMPVRRLCRRFTARLRFRKRGILILSQEVQACEYEDVQIMWEMLKKTESIPASSPSPKWLKKKPIRNALAWTRWGTCFSHKF
ncbi:unnamed protein product [Amaranthus hypochondriacus]